MKDYFKKLWNIRSFRFVSFGISALCIILFCVFYFTISNEEVIFLRGEHLKKADFHNGITEYAGRYEAEEIKVTVTESNEKESTVRYILPQSRSFTYTVVKSRADGREGYKDEIKIVENDRIIFDGYYGPDEAGICLYEKNGTPYFGKDDVSIVVNNDKFPADYKPSLSITARLAYHDLAENRGSPGFLFLLAVTLILYIIDRKYPLLFFTWEHYFSVKNPEPSDFYLALQRICWYVIYPIVILFFLVGAVRI